MISFENKKQQMMFLHDLFDDWEKVYIATNKYEKTTTEPLIKDEKIRKAVRAWADANGDIYINYDDGWGFDNDRGDSITFNDGIKQLSHLSDHRNYTIAELCGEEEE